METIHSLFYVIFLKIVKQYYDYDVRNSDSFSK
jgi:hypothetical protein